MVFKDRIDAGKQLAQHLAIYKDKPDTVVLGLTRGGIVPAFYVAQALNAPLDIVIPRKIGAPGNPELAVGALAEDGTVVFNDQLMRSLGLHARNLKHTIETEKNEAARRIQLYRAGRNPLDLTEKTVILVDDGIATGATMRASIVSARSRGAKFIVVAVPVAPAESLDEIRHEADELICLYIPEAFWGVGGYYQSFPQVQDQEVIDLLAAAQ
ncbi:MAG TPA: phosphoribosyltransferase [Candidatus Dependentiae bacterium]|jgi:putative phosphoribosyl transferase|nr:phosphoribosyltransferase [Candidatus Dependentiae bacterium]